MAMHIFPCRIRAFSAIIAVTAMGIGALAWRASIHSDSDHSSALAATPGAHHTEGSFWDTLNLKQATSGDQPVAGSRTPSELRDVLYKGSFAGTHPFGDWCVAEGRQLRPCPLLRDRFEYYINGLGEITPAEVRILIEDEARQAHGAMLATRIMAVFDAYWTVRNHEYPSRLDMADTSTWLPALREAQAFRKQTLGEDWARAFFAADDQEFMATLAQASAGQAPPPSPRDPVPMLTPDKDPQALRNERVARYGEDAAKSLEALDAEQAQFDRHVAEARQEWTRLQAQGNLSASAQEAQLKAFIAERVAPKNLRRAWALATVATR
ncbi:MAG: hypothetical protein RI907_2326 [Pseudomonadota bacterium]|jgi:lipase chaperone LimK